MSHVPSPGAVDPAGIRAANLSRVARAALAIDPAPTRADIATATSTTRATVSRLVDDLLAGGVLVELDQTPDGRRGRPGTPLGPCPDRFVALGLQVNVGYLCVLAVDLRGTVVGRRRVDRDLRDSDPAEILGLVTSSARETLAELPPGVTVVGARLALPGIVSTRTNTLLHAPNLGWSDVAVAAELGPGVPLTIGNEADLAAATVSLHRPGRPTTSADFVYRSGEVGIGGCVVVGGLPLPGRHGWAGEIGHVTVDPSGPACACGSTGCLELYAGEQALLETAGMPRAPSITDLAHRVRNGDQSAADAVDRAARALGIALAAVVNIVDVPVVVLDGHLRELAGLLRPGVEAVLWRRVLSAAWAVPVVQPAEAHPAPGALGGAYLELERLIDDPARWIAAH